MMEQSSDAAVGLAPDSVRGDLDTPTEIHNLVTSFYREVVFDELLEPVFGEVAEVDWAEHIPRLIDYWCWILLRQPGYRGALMETHRHLHGLEPLRREHCDRWYALWVRSVDEQWRGPKADEAKHYAARMMSNVAGRIIGIDWQPPG